LSKNKTEETPAVEELTPEKSQDDEKLQKLFQSYYTQLFRGQMPLSKFNQLVNQAASDRKMTRDEMEYFIRQVKSEPIKPVKNRFEVMW